jgi:hypothetical protein
MPVLRKLSFAVAAGLALGAVLAGLAPAAAAPKNAVSATTSDLAAQRRAGVYVTSGRRGPGPNSVRQCRSWLAQEYRVSGTVVVPRMQCWWE